jgi:hypothetical protein
VLTRITGEKKVARVEIVMNAYETGKIQVKSEYIHFFHHINKNKNLKSFT